MTVIFTNWISEANEINGYSPRLAESCYVYRKDELGVRDC